MKFLRLPVIRLALSITLIDDDEGISATCRLAEARFRTLKADFLEGGVDYTTSVYYAAYFASRLHQSAKQKYRIIKIKEYSQLINSYGISRKDLKQFRSAKGALTASIFRLSKTELLQRLS